MEKSRAGTKNIIHSVIQSSQPVSGPSSFLIHSITKLQFLSRILQHFESLANFFYSSKFSLFQVLFWTSNVAWGKDIDSLAGYPLSNPNEY